MPGNPPSVVKLFGHNDDFKVRLRTVWYIVIVAFVDNLEMQRLELGQFTFDLLLDVHIQASLGRIAVLLAARSSILPCIASQQHPH